MDFDLSEILFFFIKIFSTLLNFVHVLKMTNNFKPVSLLNSLDTEHKATALVRKARGGISENSGHATEMQTKHD